MPISFFKIKSKILEIWKHSGFQKYFRNTGWMFLGQIFVLGAGFFVGAWLARYLGPNNYGILNYIIAFVGIFSVIADFGITPVLSRELTIDPENKNQLLGTALRLKLYGGILAFILVLSISFFIEKSLFMIGLIALYSLNFLLSPINIINIYFLSTVKSKYNTIIQFIVTIISSILKILIILLGLNIFWVILVMILEIVFYGVGYIIVYQLLNFKIKKWQYNKKLAIKFLSSSWKLALTSGAVYIYMRVDQLMIKYFFNEKEVGLYAAAVRLVEVFNFIPGIICGSLFPAIINGKKVSDILYKSRVKKMYLLLAIIAILISIFVSIFAYFIIVPLFGVQYISSIQILRIYIWSILGLFLITGINQFLLSENNLYAIFYLSLFSMILNVGLNFILLPTMGVIGAAWATVISYSAGPLGLYIINLIKKHK